ncbi:hypothetical protein EBM89_10415 [Cellulomonas triticagri]|uniref:Uncharacterized protein n=1 Tax=Cellulomonas triticagri TaxID=2483352 RepID=A0A3M2JB06_9CELL|nr:hypothetical protein EBM89_10415 [Cellulomonas triticagri]
MAGTTVGSAGSVTAGSMARVHRAGGPGPWQRCEAVCEELGFLGAAGSGLLVNVGVAVAVQRLDVLEIWVPARPVAVLVAVVVGLVAGLVVGLMLGGLGLWVAERYYRGRVWMAARELPVEELRSHVDLERWQGRSAAEMLPPEVPALRQRAALIAAAATAAPALLGPVLAWAPVVGWPWAWTAVPAVPVAACVAGAAVGAFLIAEDWWSRRRKRLERERSFAAIADLVAEPSQRGDGR